jgi:hypothetical protein
LANLEKYDSHESLNTSSKGNSSSFPALYALSLLSASSSNMASISLSRLAEQIATWIFDHLPSQVHLGPFSSLPGWRAAAPNGRLSLAWPVGG